MGTRQTSIGGDVRRLGGLVLALVVFHYAVAIIFHVLVGK